jgi:Family of unknown function (DUF6152)
MKRKYFWSCDTSGAWGIMRSMKIKLALFILGAMLLTGAAVFGHHSFAGTYVLDKMQTVEGKVVQVSIRNPHSFITVEAPDENGQLVRWSIEAGGANQMAPQGEKAGLKVGDTLRVTGNPARSADAHRIRLVKMVRPSDGWSWGNQEGQVVQ